MSSDESFLKGKYILAVDDEKDILETITDLLDESIIDWAWEYKNASKKIKTVNYDLVILDIMGVNGLQLLEESVERGFPTVMLTAHALNPEILMESIQKGAISYLPKEKLSELNELLNAILCAFNRNEPTWELLIENLWNYFNDRWGPGWQERDREFWAKFCRAYSIGKGIQERFFK
jgi:DNA-binding response OmpR family regulator